MTFGEKSGEGLGRLGEQISHKRICTKKELTSITVAEKKLGMLSKLEKSCYTEKKYHAYTSPVKKLIVRGRV